MVAKCLAKIFNKEPSETILKAIENFESYNSIIPSRFPTFCAGCPERATLYTILKATNNLENTVICGDIGCYVMSFFPPQECSDLIICMSGGLSAAIGMSTKSEQKIIAMIGDSTFFHTGMAPLAEAVGYNSNILLIIFENSWTAMTGHQDDVLRYLIKQGLLIKFLNSTLVIGSPIFNIELYVVPTYANPIGSIEVIPTTFVFLPTKRRKFSG